MEQNNDAPHGESADNKRRIATLETALDDLIRRLPRCLGSHCNKRSRIFYRRLQGRMRIALSPNDGKTVGLAAMNGLQR
ncbi:hypothetical protein [Cupriavidus sp. D39]|uniref:hypothetical protein n=1 Tax=Cupriavidus sp. D39 TaxID=2997877 RepID=UPI00226FEF40|nr:hypothetical protein [Cupriavidus sp. D39]MCY0853287.1 hypothetical protein [Cupriavidus sp. D39]